MIPVKAYKSFDGLIFETAKECADYETMVNKLAKIVDKIPRFEQTEEFKAGKASFQHDTDVSDVIKEFKEYVSELIGEDITEFDNERITYYIFRFNKHPLTFAWTTYIACIDEENRQWVNMTLCNDFMKQPTPEE